MINVRVAAFVLALLVTSVISTAAEAGPHDWKRVTGALSDIRLSHPLVTDADRGFAERQTDDFSSEQSFAVYEAEDHALHRAMLLYEVLLPGYRFGAVRDPASLVSRLIKGRATNTTFGESFDVVSSNRRFSVSRFSFNNIGCFGFVRHWGQAQNELTGNGDRRVLGYVCGRRGVGMTNATIRDVLDGLEVRE